MIDVSNTPVQLGNVGDVVTGRVASAWASIWALRSVTSVGWGADVFDREFHHAPLEIAGCGDGTHRVRVVRHSDDLPNRLRHFDDGPWASYDARVRGWFFQLRQQHVEYLDVVEVPAGKKNEGARSE